MAHRSIAISIAVAKVALEARRESPLAQQGGGLGQSAGQRGVRVGGKVAEEAIGDLDAAAVSGTATG